MSDENLRFSAQEFAALLKWRMASDPWPVDATAKAYVTDMLNDEAEVRGYGDWVVAYHELHMGASK